MWPVDVRCGGTGAVDEVSEAFCSELSGALLLDALATSGLRPTVECPPPSVRHTVRVAAPDPIDVAAAHPGAAVVVDLRCLANINDRWGHGFGDQLLAVVAARLAAVLAARAGQWAAAVPAPTLGAALDVLAKLTAEPLATVPTLDSGSPAWPLLDTSSPTAPDQALHLVFSVAAGSGDGVVAAQARVEDVAPRWYDRAPTAHCPVCATGARYTGTVADPDRAMHVMVCPACGHRWTVDAANPA